MAVAGVIPPEAARSELCLGPPAARASGDYPSAGPSLLDALIASAAHSQS